MPWNPGNVNDAMVNSAEKFDLWRKRGGKTSHDDVDVEYHFCTDLRDNIASLLAIHIKYAVAVQDLHVNLGEVGDTLSNMPNIGGTDLDPIYGKWYILYSDGMHLSHTCTWPSSSNNASLGI